MIFLSGHVHRELHYVDDLGFMLTPAMGNRIPRDHVWAADTGCFNNPWDGESFTVLRRRYLDWLSARNPDTCLFATAPDYLGDMVATLELSRTVLPAIRELGYSPALVAQDGAERIPLPWGTFDCLFIGGTTEWKEGRGSLDLCEEAADRGKWVHMGRVNAMDRMLMASWRNCHSVDGTCLAFGRTINYPKIRDMVKWINGQEQFSF